MNRFFKLSILLFAVSAITFSCVSKKKFDEMTALKDKMKGMLDQKTDELESLHENYTALQKEKEACNDEVSKLQKDSLLLAHKKQELEEELSNMTASCETMKGNYDQLKSQSSKKIRDLIDELETLQEDLVVLQSDLNSREKRLAEVESKLNQRDSIMQALQNRISDALLGFQDKGLTVDIRDGKVYVSLSNQLLFRSGSTKIDSKGKEALTEFAKVMTEEDGINIMVEGHTDNVPISNLGSIKDNWDLSVMRSTEVVRIIVDAGVEPTRIVPSGRGEYFPIDPRDTKEARSMNRRTEIILSPKLDELYKLIKTAEK